MGREFRAVDSMCPKESPTASVLMIPIQVILRKRILGTASTRRLRTGTPHVARATKIVGALNDPSNCDKILPSMRPSFARTGHRDTSEKTSAESRSGQVGVYSSVHSRENKATLTIQE